MAKQSAGADGAEFGTLVREVVRDGSALLRQQVDLLRAEARQEVGHVAEAGAAFAAGGTLAAAGGVMAALMGVHLLHRASGLPLWACYGAAAGACGAGAATLLLAGRRRLAEVQLLPQSTVAAKENLTWLKEQLTSGTP